MFFLALSPGRLVLAAALLNVLALRRPEAGAPPAHVLVARDNEGLGQAQGRAPEPLEVGIPALDLRAGNRDPLWALISS